MAKHPAEALADLLDDPLPADWQDALAIQARQDHLGALAILAADAATDLLIGWHQAVVKSEGFTPDHPAMTAYTKALLALARGWSRYTGNTARGDAGQIVYRSAEFAAGPAVAAMVEGSLERVWAIAGRVLDELDPH